MDIPSHEIFDQRQLRLRQKRAVRRFTASLDRAPDFLIKHAAADIGLRLKTINRQFGNAVDLFGRTGDIAAVLANSAGISNVVRLENEDYYLPKPGTTIKISSPDPIQLNQAETDLVVSVFALHWSNDLPSALTQIINALCPDGLFLGLILGPDTLNELRSSFVEVESRLFGGVSPRVDPFIPVQVAGALLQRTGFALPVVDTEKITVRYGSALDLMHDLRAMGATSVMKNRDHRKFSRKLFDLVCEHYAKHFSDADGRIRATFELISLSGWAPHQNQQQPLKPGSAKIHLGELLKQNSEKD